MNDIRCCAHSTSEATAEGDAREKQQDSRSRNHPVSLLGGKRGTTRKVSFGRVELRFGRHVLNYLA